MKQLSKILGLLLVSLMSAQSFARVDFFFTHIAPAYTAKSAEIQPLLAISASSASQGHSVSMDNGYIFQGESSQDYVTKTFLAPDPTGLYQVIFQCYLSRPKQQAQKTLATRVIAIEKNSGVVQIQAACPVSLQGDLYVLQQPSDISIKIIP